MPNQVAGLLGGVQEEVAELVPTDGEAGGECVGKPVGGEDVEVAVFDEGGLNERVEHAQHAGGHRFPPGAAPAPARRLGDQCQQVLEVLVVELQHPGDRLEHLDGGVAITTAFQAQVVVGADAGEHRDLLSP
jgi:hypothetical protein